MRDYRTMPKRTMRRDGVEIDVVLPPETRSGRVWEDRLTPREELLIEALSRSNLNGDPWTDAWTDWSAVERILERAAGREFSQDDVDQLGKLVKIEPVK